MKIPPPKWEYDPKGAVRPKNDRYFEFFYVWKLGVHLAHIGVRKTSKKRKNPEFFASVHLHSGLDVFELGWFPTLPAAKNACFHRLVKELQLK